MRMAIFDFFGLKRDKTFCIILPLLVLL